MACSPGRRRLRLLSLAGRYCGVGGSCACLAMGGSSRAWSGAAWRPRRSGDGGWWRRVGYCTGGSGARLLRRPNTATPPPSRLVPTRPGGADPDPRRTDGTALARGCLTWRGQLPQPHRGHRGERSFMADLRADDPRQHDRDHDAPGDRPEERDPDPALDGQHEKEDHDSDAPRHVAGTEWHRRPWRAEPDGVDAVHLVVGTYAHRGPSRSAGEQARDPRAYVLPGIRGHRQPDDGQRDDDTAETPHDARVVTLAAAEPQQEQRDHEQQ